MLAAPVLDQRAAVHDAVLSFHAAQPGTLLERAHRLLVHTQLRRVLQFEDFLSMQASVEARVPFLDHRLVEWCFSQPFDAHVHAPTRQGRVLLRQAMARHLPDELTHRPKQAFPHPDRATLHRGLRRLAAIHARAAHPLPGGLPPGWGGPPAVSPRRRSGPAARCRARRR